MNERFESGEEQGEVTSVMEEREEGRGEGRVYWGNRRENRLK